MKPSLAPAERRASARSLDDLMQSGLVREATPELRAVAEQFSVSITPAMLDIINADDPHDPIAAQFMPKAEELFVHPEERDDPISDFPFTPVKGVVHRHPDRVLLKLTLTCPVHCRFCFRREQMDTAGNTLLGEELDAALGYIEQHPEIWEVILTGGDPFIMPDKHLAEVVTRLNAMPHVKIIRVHTRVPSVNPERITPELIAAMLGRAPVYILLHCNHPRELTDAARAACARLIDAGFPMLSQSVLLRGVNDDAATLEELMRALVECRIKPYYLHQADLTRGTSHFRVPIERGRALMRELHQRASGLAQPSYVLDIPGGHGKVPVEASYVKPCDGGHVIEDWQGEEHIYRETGESPAS